MEYAIISGKRDDVEQRVNNLIARGWRPVGGVCLYNYPVVMQAMLKTTDQNN